MSPSLGSAREQSRGEEIANAISHGVGVLLALASLPILLVFGSGDGGPGLVVGASLFAASAIVLYGASTLYHALPPGVAKRFFQRLDHAAIYLFIAGSYMPFTFGVLRGGWGWTLFGIVWALAAAGFALKMLRRLRHPLASTALYLALGWVVLLAVVPLVQRISTEGLALLVAGGLAYTAGALLYLFDSRWRYLHFVWHLFVLGGSVCHFLAALWQGPPPA